MNYNLAKKLKDAGFPQPKMGLYHDEDGNTAGGHLEHLKSLRGIPSQLVYRPALSELIEACGDRFNALVNKGGLWLATGGMSSGIYGDEFLIQGSTPEEAVANLWLALKEPVNKD